MIPDTPAADNYERETLDIGQPPASESDDRRPRGHVEPCDGERPCQACREYRAWWRGVADAITVQDAAAVLGMEPTRRAAP